MKTTPQQEKLQDEIIGLLDDMRIRRNRFEEIYLQDKEGFPKELISLLQEMNELREGFAFYLYQNTHGIPAIAQVTMEKKLAEFQKKLDHKFTNQNQ